MLLVSFIQRLRLTQGHEDLLLCFLLRVYSFSSHTSVWDLFWVNFYVWYKERIQNDSSACGYPVIPISCWKDCLSPLNCLGTVVKSQLTINVMVYFLESHFCSIDLCLSSSWYNAGLISVALGIVSSPTLFLSKVVLAILSPLHFHIHFRIKLPISATKAAEY